MCVFYIFKQKNKKKEKTREEILCEFNNSNKAVAVRSLAKCKNNIKFIYFCII